MTSWWDRIPWVEDIRLTLIKPQLSRQCDQVAVCELATKNRRGLAASLNWRLTHKQRWRLRRLTGIFQSLSRWSSFGGNAGEKVEMVGWIHFSPSVFFSASTLITCRDDGCYHTVESKCNNNHRLIISPSSPPIWVSEVSFGMGIALFFGG